MEAQVAALLLAVLWFRTSHLTFLSLSFLDCKVGQISAQMWGRNQWHNVHENDSHHVEYLTLFLYVTKGKLHRPQIVNWGSRPLWSIKCLPVSSILYSVKCLSFCPQAECVLAPDNLEQYLLCLEVWRQPKSFVSPHPWPYMKQCCLSSKTLMGMSTHLANL